MTPPNAILVTTDTSDDAHNAVQRAALLAARHGARLTLLRVIDPLKLKGPRAWFSSASRTEHKVAVAQAELSRLAAKVAAQHGVSVAHTVVAGRPLEHVCRMAEDADLLVIGSRRVNPLKSLILGTPTEQLLRLVRRPVLVVKQMAQVSYERVLVAVDLDTDCEPMLRKARALAPAAALHAFHALSTRRMDRMQASDVPEAVVQEVGAGERQRGLARLRSMLASIGLSGVQASVEHGDPRHLALQKQLELDADLIVLGKDGHSALCHFLLGGVPQHVLSGANCDVLAMPKARRRGQASATARATWIDSSPRRPFETADVLPRVAETAAHTDPRAVSKAGTVPAAQVA